MRLRQAKVLLLSDASFLIEHLVSAYTYVARRSDSNDSDMQILESWVAAVDVRLQQTYGSPRRGERDPVSQLVGTMLSQATTDAQTARALTALRRRFPAWEQVRDAPAAAIAKAIHSSGLSRQKAPRIKQALQQITRERGKIELDFLKHLPVESARNWLLRIAGVGPKTAAIVLLFSFHKPLFPVDTHIHRVSKRLGWIPSKTTAQTAHHRLEPLIPPRAHYRLHVNLLRHGRAVCQARRPRCEVCVLRELCRYYQTQRTQAINNGGRTVSA